MLFHLSNRNSPAKTHWDRYADQHDGHQLLRMKTVKSVQTAIENMMDLRVVLGLLENQSAAFCGIQTKNFESLTIVQQ